MGASPFASFGTTVVVPGCTAKLGYLAGPMQYAYCGDNMASSFCERINSVAKAVLTEGRTLLSEEELEMVVVLRVNKKFIAHMKEKPPEIARSVAAAMPLFNTLK